MPVARFASVEQALAEVGRLRDGRRLEAAIGLARRAIREYPEQAELRSVLVQLYVDTGQPALARKERAAVEQLRRQAQTIGPAPVLATGVAAGPTVPDRARLLAAILPAEQRAALEPVAATQRQQLQELVSPLVNQLIQLEAALAGRPDVPAEVRDMVHQSRAELRASQSQLEHTLIGPRAHGDGPLFASKLGPAGQPQLGAVVSHGPEVLALQKVLNREKIPIAFTGNYDPQTQKAVYKLQERYRLQRSGVVVDADTLNLLKQLAARHHLGGPNSAR